MDYRILGRLEVADGEQVLPSGGSRQRALLAVLLINRRQLVSLDRLTERLWDGSPPLSAAKTIQVYVSRLRKVLGASVVETVVSVGAAPDSLAAASGIFRYNPVWGLLVHRRWLGGDA